MKGTVNLKPAMLKQMVKLYQDIEPMALSQFLHVTLLQTNNLLKCVNYTETRAH